MECGGSAAAFSPPTRQPYQPSPQHLSLIHKTLLGGLPFAPSAKGGPLPQQKTIHVHHHFAVRPLCRCFTLTQEEPQPPLCLLHTEPSTSSTQPTASRRYLQSLLGCPTLCAFRKGWAVPSTKNHLRAPSSLAPTVPFSTPMLKSLITLPTRITSCPITKTKKKTPPSA